MSTITMSCLGISLLSRNNCKIFYHLAESLKSLDLARRSSLLIHQPHRNSTTKHFNIKWRELRRKKYLKVDIPDIQKMKRDSRLTPDEMRIRMKKEGVFPPRSCDERPINISCTSSFFEPYVPPEGDGRRSIISKEGTMQSFNDLKHRGRSLLQMRKMKKFEDDFNHRVFAQEAQELYIESQNLLGNWKDNKDRLHDLVTEKAFTEMVHGLERKTLKWKLIEMIEPPRTVCIRTTTMMTNDNYYAQVTVRIFSRQTMAIYDQFGRLMYGSEQLVKDVLEYVVFEKHIANTYGVWRVHGKIIPDWMPPRETVLRTYRQAQFDEIVDDEAAVPADASTQLVTA